MLKFTPGIADTMSIMYRHGDYTHDPERLAAIAAACSPPAPAGGRVLVAGDVHGNFNHLHQLIARAKTVGINVIAQVGDFGYWPHIASDNRSLTRANRVLARDGIVIVFIDGNHENFEALWQDRPLVPGTPFRVIESNILYAPRGSRWQWDGVSFLAVGGASSSPTDRAWRAEKEAKRGRKRWLWWHEETLTDADVTAAISGGHADVLLCHDAPSSSDLKPHVEDLREDPDTWDNRGRLQRIVEAVRPKLVFHGHWHVRYSGECGGFDFACRCEGLGADIDKEKSNSYVVLDGTTGGRVGK
jgi:Icc-related predicted phosphoesterase